MADGFGMKKAADYRNLAEDCRALARAAQNGEHQKQFLIMAETWEGLERQRVLMAGCAGKVSLPKTSSARIRGKLWNHGMIAGDDCDRQTSNLGPTRLF